MAALRKDTGLIGNLSGRVLLAHPSLTDPNFSRSVVLLSAHSHEDGALGVVINRPLDKTLGELNTEYADGPLEDIPLYMGGPVRPDEMLLTAWSWSEASGTFRFFFGIDQEKAGELMEEDPDVDIRGFLGYSGWSGGQLEGELKQDAWLVSNVSDTAIQSKEGRAMWREFISQVKPDLLFLADAPDDPSAN